MRTSLFFAALSFVAQANAIPFEIPAGTKVHLALIDPLWAKAARVGAILHFQAAFPLALENRLAIPAGTFVEGRIDILMRPGILTSHAEMRIHFTQLLYANGYTVALAGPVRDSSGVELTNAIANATVNVVVTRRNDVLLENGWPVEMVFEGPVAIDEARAAAAASVSRPPVFGGRSATLCYPAPGTPGTADTVVPGTPPTPPTIIPGANGSPDTVIPGSPGTPDSVIPGSPGIPGTACPDPPMPASRPITHNETFHLKQDIQEAGIVLPHGYYEVQWDGLGPSVEVRISGKKQTLLKARVVALEKNAAKSVAETLPRPDGSYSLQLVQFSGRSYGLRFDE